MTAKIKPFLVAAVFLAAAASAFFQQRQITHLRQQVSVAAAHVSSANAKPTLNQLEASLQKILAEPDNAKRAKLVADFAKSLDTAEAHALLEFLAKMAPNDKILGIEGSLIPIWAQDDPAAVLAWVESNFKEADRLSTYREILEAWMDKDPQGALQAAYEMLPGASSLRRTLLGVELGHLAEKNPQLALNLVGTLPLGEQQTYYYSIFTAWATADPAGAGAAASNLPLTDARNRALNIIGGKWALLDGPAALAWADSLPPGNARNSALTGAMTNLYSDPQTAISYIANVPTGIQRDSLITSLLNNNNLITTDPSAALAWVDDLATVQTRDKTVTGILSQISKNGDPADAVAYLAQTPDATIRDAVIPDVAAGLAKQDPTAALAWVQSLPDSDGTTRQKALDSVVTTWAGFDPTAAVTYIQQNLPDDPNANKIVTQATDNMANNDPQAAITLAESLSAGPAQDAALSTAIGDYAKGDPQAAWDDAMQLPAGDNQVQTLNNVIAAWSNLDPVKAATLLDNLPPGTAQDAATSKVATNWFKHDPDAASQWFDTLPVGSVRDHAAPGQVSFMAKSDLPGAFALAASIGDATIRNNQLNSVIQKWAKKDPAAALGALSTISLTPQQLTTLTNLIQTQTPAN